MLEFMAPAEASQPRDRCVDYREYPCLSVAAVTANRANAVLVLDRR